MRVLFNNEIFSTPIVNYWIILKIFKFSINEITKENKERKVTRDLLFFCSSFPSNKTKTKTKKSDFWKKWIFLLVIISHKKNMAGVHSFLFFLFLVVPKLKWWFVNEDSQLSNWITFKFNQTFPPFLVFSVLFFFFFRTGVHTSIKRIHQDMKEMQADVSDQYHANPLEVKSCS